jgi:hypothetical protein
MRILNWQLRITSTSSNVTALKSSATMAESSTDCGDIKINLSSIHSIGGYVLAVNPTGDRRLYDPRFDDLLVKADVETTEPIQQIVAVHPKKFPGTIQEPPNRVVGCR